MKRHERFEIPWKIIQVERDEQEDSSREKNPIKLRKMRKRKKDEEDTFHKKKRGVFSQVKKNESALEKIKGYQGEIQIHTGKMEVCQIERKNEVEWKPIKFEKKISKKKRNRKKARYAENLER